MLPGIIDEIVLMESRISASVLITADNAVVSQAIQEHAQEFAGAFAVLSSGSIRIRHTVEP
jgi:hypothetical protein